MTTFLIHKIIKQFIKHPFRTILIILSPELLLLALVYVILMVILGGGSSEQQQNCTDSDNSASDESVPKSSMATAKAMWAECKRRGLSDAAAAGVCGQSHQEDTTLNTDEYNGGCKTCGDGGHGLFQATPKVDGSYGSIEHYGAVHHKNWRAPATQVDMFLDDWFKPYIHRHGTVSQEAYWASEAEGGGSTRSDTNEANRQGGARWFYNKFHGTAGGASDAADSAGEGSGSSSCDDDSSDTADGTGSIKEHVPAWGLHYKPDEVPSDIKKYIHSPKDLGMSYGSSHGWSAPGGECVNLSNSYFHLMYKTSKPYVTGNGIDIAPNWSHEMKGSLTHTPHAGAVASTSNTNLTGGNSAGHTFIIEHVLSDGDMVGVEENWPGKSGDDHGSPGPNRWDFFVYPKSIDKDTKFFLPSKHVKW